MKRIAFRGTMVVLAHMMILMGHGEAHSHLHIEPSQWQRAFILIVIFLSPVFAAFLLWTRWQKTGLKLLGVSLGGSLLFGLYYHFVASGIDSVFNPIQSHWNFWFLITSILLAVVELAGCVWCFVPSRFALNSGSKATAS